MKFFVCAQMLMLGATRYFARGMELGLSRDLADRIFIITTVQTCPLQRICVTSEGETLRRRNGLTFSCNASVASRQTLTVSAQPRTPSCGSL